MIHRSTINPILEISDRYVQLISEQLQSKKGYLDQEVDKTYLPESIGRGGAGLILFLIELYRLSQSPKHLQLAEQIGEQLLEHCQLHSTNNFSLYTGRGGLVYALLELHSVTNNPQFIESSLQLMDTVDQDYLISPYTTDYLYDGRSGTLLVLLRLYQLTQSELLLELCQKFIEKIASNGILSTSTVHWHSTDELNIRPSAGFAHGSAGIAYVLGLIPGAGAKYLKALSLQYIDSCWVEAFTNWGNYQKDILKAPTLKKYVDQYTQDDHQFLAPSNDFGWADGTAGIASLYFGTVHAKSQQALSTLEQQLQPPAFSSSNLYEGSAGIGLFLLESARHSKEAKAESLIQEWVDRFLAHSSNTEATLDGGLLFGDLGMIYFLIRSAVRGAEPLLFPRLSEGHSLADSDLSISIEEIKEALLSNCFPKTIYLIKSTFPKILEVYLEESEFIEVEDERLKFIDFWETINSKNKGAPLHEILKDVLQLEKEKLEWKGWDERSSLRAYLDEFLYKDMVIHQLNQPEQWLLEKKLQLAPQVRLIKTRWSWIHHPDTDYAENLLKVPSEHLVMLRVRPSRQTQEFYSIIPPMLIESFAKPKSTGKALKEVRKFLKMMNQEDLTKISIANGCKGDVQRFWDRLDFIFISEIKNLIYNNILVFA